MSMRSNRRRFFQATAAGGALLGLGDLSFLSRLRPVSAEEASLDPKVVRLQPEIEALVRLLEETPRDRLIETIAALIQKGLSCGRTPFRFSRRLQSRVESILIEHVHEAKSQRHRPIGKRLLLNAPNQHMDAFQDLEPLFHFRRAMPQNLYASKCFSLRDEGKCAPSDKHPPLFSPSPPCPAERNHHRPASNAGSATAVSLPIPRTSRCIPSGTRLS